MRDDLREVRVSNLTRLVWEDLLSRNAGCGRNSGSFGSILVEGKRGEEIW